MNFINKINKLIAQNDIISAQNVCKQWLQQEPKNADAYHLLGITHAKNGDFNQAVDNFEQAIICSPKEAIYYNNLSNALKKTGEIAKATAVLHEALRLTPNYAEGYNNLGSLYYTQGRIDNAITYLEKALRLNPKYWEAHFNLANCLIKKDYVKRAISHYESAKQYCPNNLAIIQNLGMAYVVNKQYEESLPLLELASKYETNNEDLQAQLAEVYLELGHTSKAISQFNQAIALDSSRAEWHHNLAVLYLRNNEKELALSHFKRTLELQPNNDTAKHMTTALSGTDSNNAPSNYVSSLFDQYAQFYNHHMKESLQYKVPELLRSLISKNLKIDKTINILDVGCGTGLCGPYFKDIAKFFVGIDLSSNMLAIAKKLGAYDALCQGDISTVLPGDSQNFFDLILAADVLVYSGNLEQIFINCSESLKQNGHFALTIETTDKDKNYVLTNSGRFSHSKNYILNLAKRFNFELLDYQQCDLRQDQHQAINGAIILLSKIN